MVLAVGLVAGFDDALPSVVFRSMGWVRGEGSEELGWDFPDACWIAWDLDLVWFGWLESWIRSIRLSIEEASLLTIARRTPLSELERTWPACADLRFDSILVSSSWLLTVSEL